MAGDKSYAKQLVRRNTGREVDELLRELYVEKRHTQNEIAKALGVSRGAIVAWLAEYDINREDRSPVAIEPVTA